MSATLGQGQRGLGGGGSSLPDGRHLTEAEVDALAGLSAKEAIDTLPEDWSPDKLDIDPPADFPGPVAEAFYHDNAPLAVIQGPVGSGKTTTLIKSRLRRARQMPRSVITGERDYSLTAIRANYRQLWSTTIPDFIGVFPKRLGEWTGGAGGPASFAIRFEDEFGFINLRANFMAFGDDIAAAMRGLKPTDIWLHEADTNPEDVLSSSMTRIGRYPDLVHFAGYAPEHLAHLGQVVGDMNAPVPDSWAVRQFEIDRAYRGTHKTLADGAVSYHRQPGYGEKGCENLRNLPPGYYDKVIAAETARGRGDTIDRLVRNKLVYVQVGEPVFKREFSARVHVTDGPLAPWPGVPLRIGLDQGLKGAAVIGQCITTGSGRFRKVRWRILAELHFPDERLLARVFGERLADLIETRFPGYRVEGGWADMAGEHGSSTAADENDTWNRLVGEAAGFRVRPQRIGTNRITPRLEAIRALLEAPLAEGEPGIVIDPGCTQLIAGFEARYVWTEEINASGDKRKVPDKSFTEANVMDALQYLALSEHRANGLSPMSFPDQRPGAAPIGHNGGPPLDEPAGIRTAYDVLNPGARWP